MTKSIRLWSLCILFVLSFAQPSIADRRGSSPYLETLNRYYGEGGSGVAKIMNGKDASWKNHEWQVALLVSWIADPTKAQFCGGSIISKNWVVTAAHCVNNGLEPSDITVLSGTDNLAHGGAVTNVREIFIHSQYDVLPHSNDIALLHVDGDLIGDPISLATAEDEAKLGTSVAELTVTGWGLTELGVRSKQLKQVTVPIVSQRKCNSPPSYDGRITDTMLCAGYPEGRKDSCQGDSGGPAEAGGKLYGIVSWGDGCGVPFKFGVYANVAKLSGWVSNCMKDTAACTGALDRKKTSGKSTVSDLKYMANTLFSSELADDIVDQISADIAQFERDRAAASDREDRSWRTAYLADRFYAGLGTGTFSNVPTVSWNGFDQQNNRPVFIYLPGGDAAFSYRSASGRTIQPKLMDTDGGSTPLFLHSLSDFSTWKYGPGYIIHDWIFVAHKCDIRPDMDISFEYSATLLAESMKTLMEVGFTDYDGVQQKIPKSEDAVYLVYKAVNSRFAKRLWDDKTSVTCR